MLDVMKIPLFQFKPSASFWSHVLFFVLFSLFYVPVHIYTPLKIFNRIILSLSLYYNKTVWHVLVHKMIVSLIISDTTVCAS